MLKKISFFVLGLYLIFMSGTVNLAFSEETEKQHNNSSAPAELDAELIGAAERGDIGSVKALLEKGARIDAKDAQNSATPLMWAVARGHEAVVAFLLFKGADPLQKDRDGVTPVELATALKNQKIAKLFESAQAKTDNLSGQPSNASEGNAPSIDALVEASIQGNDEGVRNFLAQGIKPNLKNEAGITPLAAAAIGGHVDVVKTLLDSGADTSLRNKEGYTPLAMATAKGHLAVVKVLLEKGATVDSRAQEGLTPLILACSEGHKEIVQTLVGSDAEVNVKTPEGITPLWVACAQGHSKIVKILIEHGAGVNSANKDGVTPLSAARAGGHKEIVKILKAKGAKEGARAQAQGPSGSVREGHSEHDSHDSSLSSDSSDFEPPQRRGGWH